MNKILVTDAYSSRTLAFARSIAGTGFQLSVGGSRPDSLTFYSRYVTNKFLYTSYLKNAERFVRDVYQFSENNGIECIIPISEPSIDIFSGTVERPDGVRLAVPHRKAVEVALNKRRLLETAVQLQVTIPKTLFVDQEMFGELGERNKLSRYLGKQNMVFPLIMKWARSKRVVENMVMVNEGTHYFTSLDELVGFLRQFPYKDKELLIQEFISGEGYGCSGLAKNGGIKLLFCHKRIRESNPTGGPSALAESISPLGDILEPTSKILDKLDWFGPFMMEFKRRKDTGHLYLMEMNGRLWGSYPLAVKAGLNIPLIYLRMIQGEEVEQHDYRTGIRGRYLWGDLKNLYLVFKGKPRSWPGDFPSCSKALLDFVRSTFDRNTFWLDIDIHDFSPTVARLWSDAGP